PIYDTLLGSDPNTGAIIGGIAETWEQGKDGLSWTFRIRKGLQWHNGDPITAEDVKFSFESYLAPDAINGDAWRLRVASGEVVDQYTFKANLKQIDVYFASAMSRAVGENGVIIPKKYVESIGFKEFARKPVGSGSWTFKESATGVKVVFQAWDKHWKFTPKFQTFTIVMVPEESTRVAMLRTGQAGIAMIEPDSMPELRKAGVKMVTVPAVEQSTYYIWGTYDPRYKDSPIANVKVREALSLALNRQEIIDFVMEGEAAMPVAYGTFRYSLDTDVPYWEKWSKDKLRYDPAAAKKLIADAGYPNGFKMTFLNYDRPGSAYQRRVGEAQAGYWRKVGIDVDVRMTEWGVFSPMRRVYDPVSGSQKELAGTVSMFRAVGRPTTLDRSYSALRWDSDERVAGSPLMKTPEALQIEKLYGQSYAAIDPQDRFNKTNAALQYMSDLWLIVPVIEAGAYWAVNPELVGKFSGTPGRGELGEVAARIPRPDQSPWK
ncbi:MAG: ABC transporter substrate-binding protein, partial [Chloroflexota bacterium]|nr:ABC transporter substrate-binding protein [Chloroflexota bacterium]